MYALKRDGTVWAWGENYYGQLGNPTAGSFVRVPVQVSGLSGVKQVLADYTRAFALLADGTVRAWGVNTSGELGIGTATNTNVPVQVPASPV
ncbi:UNVERIFIED_ORG: alpha-tubulin suppressor-like RCC1 family protein [Arthrobacter sp. UYCu721]